MRFRGRKLTERFLFVTTANCVASVMIIAAVWLQMKSGTLQLGLNLHTLVLAGLIGFCIWNWLDIRSQWRKLPNTSDKNTAHEL